MLSLTDVKSITPLLSMALSFDGRQKGRDNKGVEKQC